MQSTIKRPGLIKAICYLGFLTIGFAFVSVFSPFVKKIGDWYPAIFGLLVACRFMSYIGLWHMKRWGVHLFIITFFVDQALLLALGTPNYISTFFSILYIIGMLFHYRKMDSNL